MKDNTKNVIIVWINLITNTFLKTNPIHMTFHQLIKKLPASSHHVTLQ